MTYLKNYMQTTPEERRSSSAIAFWAGLDAIAEKSKEVAGAIHQELLDQRKNLKLIASENYASLPVQLAMGNLLTDKYSEGFPNHRFYAGCENVDVVESRAIHFAKKIFGADHAYVQPHSGADANLVAFWAILVDRVQTKEVEKLGKKSVDQLTDEEYERVRELLVNQKMMGLSLGAGGHLTHGFRQNISSKMMRAVTYGVDPKTGRIDYRALQEQVKKEKPLILIAGYSAYSRKINFAKMREIADTVGAVLLVDMAHFAGLVAGKVFTGEYDPIPFADFVTTTTHKTLRGPRGGMVLCKEKYREGVDRGCPLVLGGPLPHVMAAKALAFEEAASLEFAAYAKQVVQNSQAMAETFLKKGAEIVTGGTENHLFIVDVQKSFALTGRQAEKLLFEARITVNRNAIVDDPLGAWYTSGIRIGTPAITTLGMKEKEMQEIAEMIYELLKSGKAAMDPKTGGPSKAKVDVLPEVLTQIQERAGVLKKAFPLYPEL